MLSSALLISAVLASLSGVTALPPSNHTSVSKQTANSPKGVYAHHIVGNTYPYTQSNWVSDIQLAQSSGIDGFALNVGSLTWEAAQVASAYAAAAQLNSGFKLFVSLDMSSITCAATGDVNNVRPYVNNYVNHPNQLYYQGKLVLSTFWGDNCLFGQANFNAAWQYALYNGGVSQSIWFIPAFLNQAPSSFGSISVMNGIMNWNSGWPQSGSDISFATDQTWITDMGGRFYIAPVTPIFFTHYSPQTYNKNWIYRSDDWLYFQRWNELIANRNSIDFVEILTWNDYGESHYIGPIEGAQPNSQAWTTGFDHTKYLGVTQYYAQAWKTGVYPTITTNKIFLTARPHAKNAVCTSDSVAQPANVAWTDDNLYAAIFAVSAGSLKLSIGSSTQTFSVTANTVNLFKIPLAVGSPSAILYGSSGNTLLTFAPSGFSYTGNSCSVYNFNYYVAASS